MDFVRYNIKVFLHERSKIQETWVLEKYEKYISAISDIKSKHSCFQPVKLSGFEVGDKHGSVRTNGTFRHNNNRFRNSNTNGPSFSNSALSKIIKNTTKLDEDMLFVQSNVNKLSFSNYNKIFARISIKLPDCKIVPAVVYVLDASFTCNTYNDLYVGLMYHIYNSSTKSMKKQIITKIDDTFASLLYSSTYSESIEAESEDYDMFCDRVKKKQSLIHKIRTFTFIHSIKEISCQLQYSLNNVIQFINTTLHEVQTDAPHDITEIIMDCLLEILTIHEDKYIPIVKNDGNNPLTCEKNLTIVKDDMLFDKIIVLCNSFIHTPVSNKIKFKSLDIKNKLLELYPLL
jgi:hypothetical protein